MNSKKQNEHERKMEKEAEVLTADQNAAREPEQQPEPPPSPAKHSETSEPAGEDHQGSVASEREQGSETEPAADTSRLIEAEVHEDLQEQYNELNNKYLRLAAEFENYKKRMEREFTRRIQFANEEFLREILPIMDDLERAMAAADEEQSPETFKSGLELVRDNFKNILKRRGVEAIDAVGEPFNPELHDAVMVQESEEHNSDTVIQEFERGYKLGDKVLRHAKVVVSR